MAMLVEIKYSCHMNDENFEHMYDKALTTHQKLAMMQFFKSKLEEVILDLESTQNRDVPVLYGISKIMILFYCESMIIFARNALDVATYVYGDLLFGTRVDSFNKLIKKVKISDDSLFCELKEYFDKETFVFSLLCRGERGRKLRDIIIYQANVKMSYYEYKENSEKESVFLLLKDRKPLDINIFAVTFIQDVLRIFEEVNSCCKKIAKMESYCGLRK